MGKKSLIIGGLLATMGAWGAAPSGGADAHIKQRYIVEFSEAPLATFKGIAAKDEGWQLAPTHPKSRGQQRLDPWSKDARAYLDYLSRQRQDHLQLMSQRLGRVLEPAWVYQYVGNGVALDLSPAELDALDGSPGIKAIAPDRWLSYQTDAGPTWIGAADVWAGQMGATPNLGEGAIIGVIDSGINWDHPAFADPGADGYNHDNPRSRQLGLCSRTEVRCNDKLIGVYDFTEEDQQIGRDLDGHGSHVASTAAGNRRQTRLEGITAAVDIGLSGVAPHANLISYKACVLDNPETSEPDDGGCPLVSILAALDQAAIDQPDVINFSLGGPAADPWDNADSLQELRMLNLREAGVLVVAAAGNSGPAAASVGAPATAPWVLSVANITHDRRFTNGLDQLSGGTTAPPEDLSGAGLTGSFGPARIVHGRDFGNALCGASTAELQPNCEDHSGGSSPFAPGTFEGEIVVCDRGTYGRVEKGFNLRAAGAGGYILLNTAEQGESIRADDHCLPAVHLGVAAGNRLRAWLDAGNSSDHQGSITGFRADTNPAYGDIVAGSSSRGPHATGVNVLKPELAAPGSNVLAAAPEGNEEVFLSGTSMATPHVAGMIALLRSADGSLSVDQLHSIAVTTSVNDAMRDSDLSSAAASLSVGSGRARADRAVNAGLYLPVSGAQFSAANPAMGGDPKQLNLPTLADEDCFLSCSFSRTVTDLAGGATWRAELVGPAGLIGSVEPASFTLAANMSRQLEISLDVTDPALVNRWVEGAVVLTSDRSGIPSARMPLAVFASGGRFPSLVQVDTHNERGQQQLALSGTVALSAAEYQTLGLSQGSHHIRFLPQDATRDDPYDDFNQGVYFVTVDLTTDDGLILARTVVDGNDDLDLFIGRDINGDGRPSLSEELCRSTSPDAAEQCVHVHAEAGRYWILVQNWASRIEGVPDTVQLRVVAVANNNSGLVATGPGMVEAGQPFDVRLIWDQGQMRQGEVWYGALIPKQQSSATELAIIPVELSRISDGHQGSSQAPDLSSKAALALGPNDHAAFSLNGGQGHGRLFIDVPQGAQQLQVDVASEDAVDLYLVRREAAFDPPQVLAVDSLEGALAQQTGAGGQHSVSVSGSDLEPGRYYIVPVNPASAGATVVEVSVALELDASALIPTPGLWFDADRSGTGLHLSLAGDQLILLWYTYLEDGTPTWYLAQAAYPQSGRVWQSDLLFFNWDGQAATSTPVGQVLLTWQSPNQAVFSFTVNGESGSELMSPIVPDLSCASEGAQVELSGLWFMPERPGFGYSVLALATQQVQINYLYDQQGFPRWVLGQGTLDGDDRLSLSQFDGFCPLCDAFAVSADAVGSNQATFDSNLQGEVSTEVDFVAPMAGNWRQQGPWVNLTPTFDCN